MTFKINKVGGQTKIPSGCVHIQSTMTAAVINDLLNTITAGTHEVFCDDAACMRVFVSAARRLGYNIIFSSYEKSV